MKGVCQNQSSHWARFARPRPVSTYTCQSVLLMNRIAPFFSVVRLAASVGLLASCLLFCGCSKDTGSAVSDQEARAKMKAAVRMQQWEEAWSYREAVLRTHGEDSATLATLAKVAHANNLPGETADLLMQSCRAESFKRESRVQQAMIAMISVGRLMDGLGFLEEAVAERPKQYQTRRWLYDFYGGTEDRPSAVPHGRVLVLARRFDVELLKSLSNTQRRSLDVSPLQQMVDRNPDDTRPLVGSAKIDFDAGDNEKAIETLNQILERYPEFLPAQVLVGRSYVAAGMNDQVRPWASKQKQRLNGYSGYWIAVADWARSQSKTEQAVRAYWEAATLDVDNSEAWTKLATSAAQLSQETGQVSEQVVQSIQQRASLLSKFEQHKSRFERSGGISRQIVLQIVETLSALGRPWEAEAWTVVAARLPEDDSVSIEDARQRLLKQLKADTPWQITAGNPALSVDLSYLPLPEIVSQQEDAALPSDASSLEMHPSSELRLVNEAEQRGLAFFGKTSDTLDQAGIMLHETLGCGGASIDYDLDGWTDLYLVGAGGKPAQNHSQPNALFRNQLGSFQAVTDRTQTADTGFGQGVAVGDVNEDGFPDLLVLNYGPNRLYINNGDGSFSDQSDALPNNQDSQAWSTSAAIVDLDGDGLSDIIVVNYCDGLEPSTYACSTGESEVVRSCSPMRFKGSLDFFLRSRGDGTFSDQLQDWGATPEIRGRGLGILAGQLDQRPGIDLYIANDMTNNHYWSRDSGSQAFRLAESAMLGGVAADDRANAQGSMGIAGGDLDQDGDFDLYVTNFEKEYNSFYMQQPGGTWLDQTASLGLLQPTVPLVGFGTQAVDLDRDGQRELIVTNGHVDLFSRGGEQSLYAQPMQIFQRHGGQYNEVHQRMPGNYLGAPHVGRSLWTIDANRDHRCDLVVTHQTEPVALLINHSQPTGDWIELELYGRSCSRDPIGAAVHLEYGGQSKSHRVTGGSGYLCSNDRVVRMAIETDSGSEDAKPRKARFCRVVIEWPDGARQELAPFLLNHRYIVVQHSTYVL